MNEWEARYKALALGITDKKLIDNAELLVRRAIEISRTTPLPVSEVIEGMLRSIGYLQCMEKRQ